jgi:hypothetical protein
LRQLVHGAKNVEVNARLVWELNADTLRFVAGALSWLWFRAASRHDELRKTVEKLEGRIAVLEATTPPTLRKDND